MEREPDPPREALDGLGERDVIHRAEEGIDIAGFAASEAVVVADLRTHVEAGASLIVKRAQALHRAHAGRFQGNPFAHDVSDVRASLDFVDVGLTDAGHQCPAAEGDSPAPVTMSWPKPSIGSGSA